MRVIVDCLRRSEALRGQKHNSVLELPSGTVERRVTAKSVGPKPRASAPAMRAGGYRRATAPAPGSASRRQKAAASLVPRCDPGTTLSGAGSGKSGRSRMNRFIDGSSKGWSLAPGGPQACRALAASINPRDARSRLQGGVTAWRQAPPQTFRPDLTHLLLARVIGRPAADPWRSTAGAAGRPSPEPGPYPRGPGSAPVRGRAAHGQAVSARCFS